MPYNENQARAPAGSPNGGQWVAVHPGMYSVDVDRIKDSDVVERVRTTLNELHAKYGLKLESVKADDIEGDSGAQLSTIGVGRYINGEKVEDLKHYLTLNRKHFETKDALKISQGLLEPGFLADPSAAGIVRHEYAHALHRENETKDGDTIRQIFKEYRKDGFYDISAYSGSSSKEMVAEAFAHYHRQGTLQGTKLAKLEPIFKSWERNALVKNAENRAKGKP